MTSEALRLAGDYSGSRGLAEKALRYFRAAEAVHGIANCLDVLGCVAIAERDPEASRRCFEESIRLSQLIADGPTLGMVHTGYGYLEFSEGNRDQAREHLSESPRQLRPFGHWPRIGRALSFLAILAAREWGFQRAAVLLGAADSALGSCRHSVAPDERASVDASLAAARESLGEEGFAQARADGQAMTLERVVEYALQGDVDRQPLAG